MNNFIILSDRRETMNRELTEELIIKTFVLQPPPPMPFEERRMLPCGFSGTKRSNASKSRGRNRSAGKSRGRNRRYILDVHGNAVAKMVQGAGRLFNYDEMVAIRDRIIDRYNKGEL